MPLFNTTSVVDKKNIVVELVAKQRTKKQISE